MERELRAMLPYGRFDKVPLARSQNMAAIRGRGNRSTEARLRALLVRSGIRGWTMQTKSINGKPDFYFSISKVAVFLDGCFWHGCPACGHIPRVNRLFWRAKIKRNQQRDRKTDALLRKAGITVLRFWEHELRKFPAACLRRVLKRI